MKKNTLIIIGAIVAVLMASIILISCFMPNESEKGESVSLGNVEDMKTLIATIYDKTSLDYGGMATEEMDFQDEMALEAYTGLQSAANVNNLVVSESMMGSIPYSLVMVKVKDTSKIEDMKKEMLDNVDMRKWICVNADVLYITNTDDVIFMVMGETDKTTSIYNEFKKQVGKNIGKELKKNFGE